MGEMADTISMEMGAPAPLAQSAQAPAGLGYLMDARKQLDSFKFDYAPSASHRPSSDWLQPSTSTPGQTFATKVS